MNAPAHSPTLTPFVVTRPDGLQSITLSVEGVHCPACIQKIESSVASQNQVREARLNYTTKRLAVAWDGPSTMADTLASTLQGLGYTVRAFEADKADASDTEHARFLRLCLGVSGFASGNIMLLSFALWLTNTYQMGAMTREFFHLVSALIAVPTVIFAGRPFFRSAAAVLAHGRTNMDVPISLGIIGATVMSLFEMFHGAEHVFFDSAVMLIFFLLIGRYLDFLALANARSAARDLVSMMAGSARVLDDDGLVRDMLIRDLRAGMRVLVGVGERIPADGRLLSGDSQIDTSPVTGESMPVAIKAGAELYSGTINIGQPITIEIARAAENSLLADVIRMMEKAEQGQAQYVRIADRAARLYTPVVHVLAAVTFAGWLMAGMVWQDALMIAVTVLIITCPCALGLAVPVVQVLAVGRLMKRGIMVKTGDALERLARVNIAMLDKTGTLTRGKPALVDAASHPLEALRLAASLAVHSKHPLSVAVCAAYQDAYDAPSYPLSVTEESGYGLESTYEGKRVRLGSRVWCGDAGAPQSPDHLELWLSVAGDAPLRFLFSDPLRADAGDVVTSLKNKGMRVILASGDRDGAVAAAARAVGIAEFHAGMKPADKFALLESLKGRGAHVLMVGDGLNDAPVLAGADVSASPASGLDIARNAADLVYTGDRLGSILTAYETALFSQKLVRQNFFLAILYNVIAVPFAMAGYVTPLLAAIAMSSSSLIVIANALRLKRVS